MDQYLLIPFLGGWKSIYQLFWCSPGLQGFDPYAYVVICTYIIYYFHKHHPGQTWHGIFFGGCSTIPKISHTCCDGLSVRMVARGTCASSRNFRSRTWTATSKKPMSDALSRVFLVWKFQWVHCLICWFVASSKAKNEHCYKGMGQNWGTLW